MGDVSEEYLKDFCMAYLYIRELLLYSFYVFIITG